MSGPDTLFGIPQNAIVDTSWFGNMITAPVELLTFFENPSNYLHTLKYGKPDTAQIQAGADLTAANVARAGGSPAEQQAAAALYVSQIDASAKNFDENSSASTIWQRVENTLVGSGDATDIIRTGAGGLPDFSQASNVALLALVAVGLFIVWYVLQEVL